MTTNCFKKAEAPFNTVDAINKFNQGIRDCEVNYWINNNNKNPFVAGWITCPTKRIDRQAKIKDVSFMKRSGYNKKIDSPEKAGYIDQPMTAKQLKKQSLRH